MDGSLAVFAMLVMSGAGLFALNAGHEGLAAAMMFGAYFVVGPVLFCFLTASGPARLPHLEIVDPATALPSQLQWQSDREAQRLAGLGFKPVALGLSGMLRRGNQLWSSYNVGNRWGVAVRVFASADGTTLCYLIGACADVQTQYGVTQFFDTATGFITPVDGGWVVSDNGTPDRGPHPEGETWICVPSAVLVTRVYAIHQRLVAHSGRKPCGVGDLSNPFRWEETKLAARRAVWVRDGWASGDPNDLTLDATFKSALNRVWRSYWPIAWIPALRDHWRRKALLGAIGGDKPFLTTLPSAAPAALPR